ncbi:unnamed protein product [Prorocentrum cordatum]|uniref:Uncharacterized protein n=1 Tax=Prorocentrum cordatum TaxID=2364126 RepID=A0ABN9QVN1_9DINO|nr:unnamed protein product [Polarella glacialis]
MKEYDTLTLDDWTMNFNFNVFTNTEGQYVQDYTTLHLNRHQWNNCTLDLNCHLDLKVDMNVTLVTSALIISFQIGLIQKGTQHAQNIGKQNTLASLGIHGATKKAERNIKITQLDIYDERGKQVDAITQEHESYKHIMDSLRKSGPPEDKKCLQGIGSPAPSRALTALEGLCKCDVGGSMKGAIEDVEAETEISKEDILDATNFVRLEKCYDHDKTKLVIGALGAPMWEGQILISRALEAEGQAVHHRDVGPVGWLEEEARDARAVNPSFSARASLQATMQAAAERRRFNAASISFEAKTSLPAAARHCSERLEPIGEVGSQSEARTRDQSRNMKFERGTRAPSSSPARPASAPPVARRDARGDWRAFAAGRRHLVEPEDPHLRGARRGDRGRAVKALL